MWKSLSKILSNSYSLHANILNPEYILCQQVRTTFILKRRTPPPLRKPGDPPKKLKSRHYIYELVKDTNTEKHPDIELILTSYVEKYGNIGDIVSLSQTQAYHKLLLPGLAVYATPENIDKYKDYELKKEDIKQSSLDAQKTVSILSRTILSITMSDETPWTLKPWHIKASFRKYTFQVPEETITLPPNPIAGPDLNLENKEFYVTVTINNFEKVHVRCRIHHWNSQKEKTISDIREFWKQPTEPIFPEDAPVLESLGSKLSNQGLYV